MLNNVESNFQLLITHCDSMAKMFLNYLSEGISNFSNISNDKTIARATLLLRRQLTAIFGLYQMENKGLLRRSPVRLCISGFRFLEVKYMRA